MAGKVYLVGAGPGSEKLLGVYALELIKKADVILYDRLAGKEILEYAKEDCELIDAGKGPDCHVMKQEDIQKLLIQKAEENKMVLRLKGGDPYIFGRGGEEAAALSERGIPFEEVPGVSSFYAACANAGIPVTYRELASSFHVFTGHFNKARLLDFDAIAKLSGTLVFLMSMNHIGEIMGGLQKAGLAPDTPAAVISWGTTPKQRQVFGTVSDIGKMVDEAGLKNPAIIVVGRVVTLSDQLFWMRDQPLFGRRALLLRGAEESTALRAALSEKGAGVSTLPLMQVDKLSDYSVLDAAIANLSAYQWLVFTSKNGVRAFFERMARQKADIRRLSHIKLFAIGDITGQALEEKGLYVDVEPEQFDSSAGSEALRTHLQAGERLLYPASALAGDAFFRMAEELGCQMEQVAAYGYSRRKSLDPVLVEELRQGAFDAVVVYSASQAKRLYELCGGEPGCLSQVKLCSIGPKTTEALQSLGAETIVTAENATTEALLQSITVMLSSD